MSNLIVIIFALIGGVAVTLQGKVMGLVSEKLGSVENVVLTYFVGALLSIVGFALFILGKLSFKSSMSGHGEKQSSDILGMMFEKISQLQWWELLGGGVGGLVIVGSIGLGVARLGTVTTLVLIIFTQLLTATIIDHYGLLGGKTYPMNFNKGMALVFIFVGVIFLLRK